MRLSRIEFQSLTRFAARVAVDFDDIGPGLVALVGENGSGKTSTLEVPAIALYRTLPTRPGFYEWFSGNAYVEATFQDDGDEVKARLLIDANRRATEPYLFINGDPETTGKAAEYDAAVEQRFGSLALFLAGPFRCQDKRGDFLGASRKERREIFVELLGCGYLQELAEAAATQQHGPEVALAVARKQIADTEADLATADSVQATVEIADAQHGKTAARLEAARAAEREADKRLIEARAAGEKIALLQRNDHVARAALIDADRELETAKAAPTRARVRRDEAMRLLDPAAIERAVADSRARHQAALDQIAEREGRLRAQLQGLPDEATARADYDAANAAVTAAKTAAARIADAEIELFQDRAELLRFQNLRAQELASAARQAGLMDQVPCTAPLVRVEIAATCPLLADARAAKEALPGLDSPSEVEKRLADEIATNEAKLATCERPDIATLERIVHEAQGACARLEAAAHARAQLDAIYSERVAAADTLGRELEATHAAERNRQVEAAKVLENYRIEMAGLHDALLAATENVEAAKARAEQARYELDQERAHTIDADAALRELSKATAARVTAERDDHDCARLLAAAHQEWDRLSNLRIRLGAMRRDEEMAALELGDWGMLAKGLGRDGVQALEIDASGPEVAALTNDLLEACYGPRFSLSFETLRAKKSAPGEYTEAFDVQVYDRGTPRVVEGLSGGERVIVGEAVSLALAIFNARKNSIRWDTLWRDETAGALDPDNARAYVAMLRRALDLGGFHQVIFVSHQPEVWNAADARLMVTGGTVITEAAFASAAIR
jgi:exonuclease SbcC